MSNEDLRQFYIRKEVLRSIAAHTCPKLYHLDIKNLAFLLFISDELNEWGRPNFEDFKSYASKSESVNVYIDNYIFAEDGDELKVSVNYKYKSEDEINIESIKKKYRLFYHLLRSAKDDVKRKFIFRWKMVFEEENEKSNIIYRFRFDSSKSPNEIIKVTKDGTNFKEPEIFDIMNNDKNKIQNEK